VQGVVQGFLKRGVRIPCFQAFVLSNVPLGGGLSSSAALEVAMATFLEALTGVTLDQREKALLCQQAEHDFAGVPCGIMDQLSSIMGRSDHLLLLDCRSRQVEQVPFHPLGISVLVTNSHVRHELGGTQYAQRRRECEQALEILGVPTLRDATRQAVERAENELGEVIRRRVRHVVDEIERVELAVAAARAGNWDRLGELMYASHDSLRDDYEVSCPELDLLVELARSLHGEGGVVGSRMTGGGFGGCTVSLVRSDRVDEVTDFVAQQYRRQTGIDPSFFLTRPSHGCVMLQG
jgi:galactokinase